MGALVMGCGLAVSAGCFTVLAPPHSNKHTLGNEA